MTENEKISISRVLGILDIEDYAFTQKKQEQEASDRYSAELQGLDVHEEFLNVWLHKVRLFRMGQDLQRIVVRDEVESWKYASLGLQVLLECQLQRFQLVVEFVQDFQQAS